MNTSETLSETTVNSLGMEFVMIPPGSFKMGGDKSHEQAEDHENPIHAVSFSKSIYMGKYAVTQAQWVAVMNSNPSQFTDDIKPVDSVSWHDVQEYIAALNNRENSGGWRWG